MARIFKGIDELIGSTPLLELEKIETKLNLKAKILAKLEYLNPAGSVKDRVAKTMIEDYHKMEEKAKQQEQKEMIEKEKTQKVEQKTEQKPKREKVGLDDLMGEEKSKKSFKKTAESQTVKKYQKENQM